MTERPRALEQAVLNALSAFRVVVVTGPRQAGKTTLVRRVMGETGTLTRLDEEASLQASINDPAAMAGYGPVPRAFDEIQRAGDPLIRAIKAAVDLDNSPGQFLLNGSADFLTVPTISESLAGRAAFLELWPFTQGEIHGTSDDFLDTAFSDPEALLNSPPTKLTAVDYLERVCVGGYPEVLTAPASARALWFRNYVRSVTQRDITELTGARQAQQLPKVLSLLAARTANELVVAHIHDESGLGSRVTTDDYISHLQMTYLVQLLPAWSRNPGKKVTRHPKIHLADTGLAAHLLGKNPTALARPTDPSRGALMESFVFGELHRQTTWSSQEIQLHHLRDRDGAEIDLIAEANDGRVVAIEVKTSASVNRGDAKWLTWLRDRLGTDFACGVVLHTGPRAFRLEDRILAVPISRLWNDAPV